MDSNSITPGIFSPGFNDSLAGGSLPFATLGKSVLFGDTLEGARDEGRNFKGLRYLPEI